MEELLIGEKKYYSSRRTGNILGYTNDYISKLCREGKLKCQMVGRSWYVAEECIAPFMELQENEKREREKKQSLERSVEYQKGILNFAAATGFTSPSLLDPMSKVWTALFFIFVPAFMLFTLETDPYVGYRLIKNAEHKITLSLEEVANISGAVISQIKSNDADEGLASVNVAVSKREQASVDFKIKTETNTNTNTSDIPVLELIGQGLETLGASYKKLPEAVEVSALNTLSVTRNFSLKSLEAGSDAIYKIGELTLIPPRLAFKLGSNAVLFAKSSVTEFGTFYSVSLNEFNTLARHIFSSGKKLYEPLFVETTQKVANVFSSVESGSGFLVSSADKAGQSIASGIVGFYNSLGIDEDFPDPVNTTRGDELAAVQVAMLPQPEKPSLWDRLIDKISNALVPLFLPNETPALEVQLAEQNNQEITPSPAVIPQTPTEIVINRTIIQSGAPRVVLSGITQAEFDLSLSSLRSEFYDLNLKTINYLNVMRVRQADKVADHGNHNNNNDADIDANTLIVDGDTLVVDADNNRVGIATSSPYATLSVAGDIALTGGIYDSSGDIGTNGMILQTTGSGIEWVSTSTLGFGGGSGTVTSVGLSAPTGLTVSGSPVTTSGTLALSLTAGYIIPLSASTTAWNTFYNTPSSRITAGTGLSWSSNTLSVPAYLTLGNGFLATATSTDNFRAGYFTGLSDTPSIFAGNIKIAEDRKLVLGGVTIDDGFSFIVDDLSNTYGNGPSIMTIAGDGGNFAFIDGEEGSTSILMRRNNVSIATTTMVASLAIQSYSDYQDVISVSSSTGASLLKLRGNGNLGIGTTSPYAKLSVVGQVVGEYFTATSTTATSTFPTLSVTGRFYDANGTGGADGMVLQTTGSGVAWVATSTLGISGGGGSGTVGSGTTGQIPYYAGNGTTLTATSTLFLATNGNVGFGSTSPVALVSVYKNSAVSTVSNVLGLSSSVTADTDISQQVYGGHFYSKQNGAGVSYGLYSESGSVSEFGTTYGIYAKSTTVDGSSYGVYGQGTTYGVAGSGQYGLYGASSNASGRALYADQVNASGYALYATGGKNYIQNNLGIGTTSPAWLLSVGGIGSFDNYVRASYFTATSTATSTFPTLSVTGRFYDANGTGGADGMVLQTTGSGVAWVATSTLGISGGGSGTVNSGTTGQIAYYAGNGTAVTGTSTLFLDTSGNVGVASSSPFGVLSIEQGTETASLWIANTGSSTPSLVVRGVNGDGNVGIGIIAPVSKLHIDAGTATASDLRFTAGATTGQTATDGFQIGITTAGVAELRQRESAALNIYTLNTLRATFDASASPRFTVYGGIQANYDALANTSTDGLIIPNNTSATVGVPIQRSGRLHFLSRVWDTGASASRIDDWINEPSLTPGNPGSSVLTWGNQYNSSGTYTYLMNLSSTGNLALGIGTTTGSARLHVISATSTQLRLGYDSSNYWTASTTSTGLTEFDAVGSGSAFNFLDNVGIGTTSPYAKLSIVGNVVATNYIATSSTLGFQAANLLGGATNLTVDANGNIIRDPSDLNLKENIEEIDGALEKILGLRGVSYEWRDKERFGPQMEIGVIAQEVELVVPEVVSSGGEYKSVNIKNLVALLIEGIKELAGKVEKMFAWFKEDVLSIQGDVCVDDVCITKDQFKALLINAGGSSGNPPPVPDPEPTPQPDSEPIPDPTPDSEGGAEENTEEEESVVNDVVDGDEEGVDEAAPQGGAAEDSSDEGSEPDSSSDSGGGAADSEGSDGNSSSNE